MNPCASIRQRAYGYKRSDTARPFTEDEMRALWVAAGEGRIPLGALL